MDEKSDLAIRKDLYRELNFSSSVGVLMFIYPFTGRSKTILFFFGFLYFLIILTACQLLITLFLKDFRDWVEIVNVVPNLAVVLMAALKYNTVHVNQLAYKKIFDHYHDDLWDVVCSEEHKKIVVKYTGTSKYLNRFFFYYSIVLLIFVNSFPRIIMYLQKVITGEESQPLYPFDGWYPFDKVNWFYVAYIWEGFMTSTVIGIYGFASIMSSSFTLYMCMELKVLGNTIERLIGPNDIIKLTKSSIVEETHQDIKSRLRIVIIRHQLLAQMASDFDKVLGDSMLFNYVFGSVFITLTIFTATVVENLYKRMRYFFMFCSLMLEMLYICLIGQLLSDHSEDLAASIYSSDWTYADNDTKKMLLILMARTQKPFQYTANGYLAMNLQSFSGICSMSYQFFNLLYTAYN